MSLAGVAIDEVTGGWEDPLPAPFLGGVDILSRQRFGQGNGACRRFWILGIHHASVADPKNPKAATSRRTPRNRRGDAFSSVRLRLPKYINICILSRRACSVAFARIAGRIDHVRLELALIHDAHPRHRCRCAILLASRCNAHRSALGNILPNQHCNQQTNKHGNQQTNKHGNQQTNIFQQCF